MKLYYNSKTNKVYGSHEEAFYEHIGGGEWEQTILPDAKCLELTEEGLLALRDSLRKIVMLALRFSVVRRAYTERVYTVTKKPLLDSSE